MTHFPFFHRWKAVASEQFEESYKGNVINRRTRVLLACPCGAWRTRELDGFWTLAQLAGHPGRAGVK